MTKPLSPEEKERRSLQKKEESAARRLARKERDKARRQTPEYRKAAAERSRRWRGGLAPEALEGHLQRKRARSAAAYGSTSGREHSVDKGLRWRFGKDFGLAEARALLASQGGACAVCGLALPDFLVPARKTTVDHCHATGRVRGILCRECNLGLGQFKDSRPVLAAAIRYLER